MTRVFRTGTTGHITVTLAGPRARARARAVVLVTAITSGINRPNLNPLVPQLIRFNNVSDSGRPGRPEAQTPLHSGEPSPVITRLDPPQSHTRVFQQLQKLILYCLRKYFPQQFPPSEIELPEELHQSQQPQIRQRHVVSRAPEPRKTRHSLVLCNNFRISFWLFYGDSTYTYMSSVLVFVQGWSDYNVNKIGLARVLRNNNIVFGIKKKKKKKRNQHYLHVLYL